MGTPASVIYMCKAVRLSPNYEHTYFFKSVSDQESFFAGRVHRTFPAYTYLRKDWSIKLQTTMETALNWDYCYFKNPTPTGDGKTYYYFVRKVEYVNDNTVEVFLEMDVLQSYYFDHDLNETFVERAHVDDDTFGSNTVDEGLELGEYVTYSKTGNADFRIQSFSNMAVLVMSTYNPEFPNLEDSDSVFNNVYCGFGVWAVALDSNSAVSISTYINNMGAKADGVIGMWMYPQDFIELYAGDSFENTDIVFHPVRGCKSVLCTPIYKPYDLDGYVPKNNKMFTYPFSFLHVTNFEGGSAEYRYEYKSKGTATNNITLKMFGAIGPDAGLKIAPIDYKNIVTNYDEALTLSAFPNCAWNQDVYKIWLAQNMNQHQFTVDSANTNKTLAAVSGAVGVVSSLATGNVLGAVGSGIGSASAIIGQQQRIEGLMAQKRDMSVLPSQAKGNYTPSINSANGIHTFFIGNKTIRKEYAERIDHYLSMYGYKINDIIPVHLPQRKTREKWSYIKTCGANPTGLSLPSDVQVKLGAIYDKGITFWDRDYVQEIGSYGDFENPIMEYGAVNE